jgi:uncharacterized membrane protein
MFATILAAVVVVVVIGVAYRSNVLAARGPLARSSSRRYDRAYERSRRRPDRG